MTEDHIIQLIRKGNPEAYRALVERYQDMVFTLCSRVLSDSFEAEEAAQETFIKAYQALNRFRGQCKFSTWLYRIAYNTALSRTRKKRFTHQLDEATYEVENAEEAFHGLDALATKERTAYLHLGLKRLPPEDCLLLSLYYLEEKELDELAEISGLEKGTVKVRIHRAKKKLYQLLCHLVKGEAKEQL